MLKKKVLWVFLIAFNLPWIITVLGAGQPWGLKGSAGPKEANDDRTAGLAAWVAEFEEDFWGRAVLIRLRNELHWMFFKKVHARNVIVGEQGYLFERSYLEAALGADALGEEEIRKRVAQMQQWAVKSGTKTIVVLAPGKGSFYGREYWPKEFAESNGLLENANYQHFKKVLEQDSTFDVLDFWAEFEEKSVTDHTLFPRNGIHWSQYSITWVTADLANFLGLHFQLEDTVQTQPYGTDEDIEQSLNLMRNLRDLPAFKIRRKWVEDSVQLPKVLCIGDSYAWGPIGEGLLAHCEEGSEFWYYNKQRFGPQVKEPGKLLKYQYGWKSEEDFVETMGQFDRIIWISTDANLKNFPFQPAFLE